MGASVWNANDLDGCFERSCCLSKHHIIVSFSCLYCPHWWWEVMGKVSRISAADVGLFHLQVWFRMTGIRPLRDTWVWGQEQECLIWYEESMLPTNLLSYPHWKAPYCYWCELVRSVVKWWFAHEWLVLYYSCAFRWFYESTFFWWFAERTKHVPGVRTGFHPVGPLMLHDWLFQRCFLFNRIRLNISIFRLAALPMAYGNGTAEDIPLKIYMTSVTQYRVSAACQPQDAPVRGGWSRNTP